MEFQPFPKMSRLSRECIITEKIDGTNAQIYIVPRAEAEGTGGFFSPGGELVMYAGSRTRWLTPNVNGSKGDNFGFAGWVERNAEELFKLGPGRHFGEWWGLGIQRGYGLTEKRFSLFNTSRWVERYAELSARHDEGTSVLKEGQELAPACCHVVPELYRGEFDTEIVMRVLTDLDRHGSKAAPGFPKPEGIVVYHTAAGVGFKKTIENDGYRKSQLR